MIKLFEILDDNHDYFVYNLTVKILTNSHNLLRNPLHWPICLLWKCSPHRVKVLRDCTYSIPFFPFNLIPIRGCLVFVNCILLSRRVRCDGVELFFVSRTVSDSVPCVRFCESLPPSPTSFFRDITVTVPYHPSSVSSSRNKETLTIFFWLVLVRWIVGRIEKLGRDVVKTLIISDNQNFMAWLSRPLIIRLCPLNFLPWFVIDSSDTLCHEDMGVVGTWSGVC